MGVDREEPREWPMTPPPFGRTVIQDDNGFNIMEINEEDIQDLNDLLEELNENIVIFDNVDEEMFAPPDFDEEMFAPPDIDEEIFAPPDIDEEIFAPPDIDEEMFDPPDFDEEMSDTDSDTSYPDSYYGSEMDSLQNENEVFELIPPEHGEEEHAEYDHHPASLSSSYLAEEDDFEEDDDAWDVLPDWEPELQWESEAEDQTGRVFEIHTVLAGDIEGAGEGETENEVEAQYENVDDEEMSLEFHAQTEGASGDQGEVGLDDQTIATWEAQDVSAFEEEREETDEEERERQFRLEVDRIIRSLPSNRFENRVKRRMLLRRYQRPTELIDYPPCFLLVVCVAFFVLFVLLMFLYAYWCSFLMENFGP